MTTDAFTTAQIIDQHRQESRSVGHGVTVHCACGAESWDHVPGDQPITSENNSHRNADRKHAQHVADHLARQEPSDAEIQAVMKVARTHYSMPLGVGPSFARAVIDAARNAR